MAEILTTTAQLRSQAEALRSLNDSFKSSVGQLESTENTLMQLLFSLFYPQIINVFLHNLETFHMLICQILAFPTKFAHFLSSFSLTSPIFPVYYL